MNVTAHTLIQMQESIDRLEHVVSDIESALDAILAHFEIPPKPPMGFRPEENE